MSMEQGQTTHQVSHSGSLVGSVNGDTNIIAQRGTVNIVGSDVVTGRDLYVQGRDVNIVNSTDTMDANAYTKFKQSGLRVSLGVTGVVGAVIDAAKADEANDANPNQDSTTRNLNGMASALKVVNSYLGSSAGGGSGKAAGGGGAKGGGAGGIMGIGLTLTVGNTKAESKSADHNTSVNSSTLSAGNTAAIIATGDEHKAGTGNILIQGSDVNAKTVILDANDKLLIESAQETTSNRSSNSSKSNNLSVSVTYDFGSQTTTVGGAYGNSSSKGSSNTDTVTQVNSHINGTDAVLFHSGGNTEIRGGQITGKYVNGDVGGDLIIESRPDTAQQNAKQNSKGINLSVSSSGDASIGVYAQKQKANGNYSAVVEQSGIFAGADGFDLTVKGKTDLTGAVIASTAEADLNRLTTGSLETHDLRNSMDYSTKTSGFNFSVSTTGGVNPGLPIPLNKSGHDSSITQSAISNGTVTITDEAAQRAATGQSAAEAIAALNRDTSYTNPASDKLPDLDQILAEQKERAAAIQAASQQVSELANTVRQREQDKVRKKLEADPAYQAEMADIASDKLDLKAQLASGQIDEQTYQIGWDALEARDQAVNAPINAFGVSGSNGIIIRSVASGINAALGGANALGILAATAQGPLASLLHNEELLVRIVGHAAIGCTVGAALGGDCGGGAAGAVTSVIAAPLITQALFSKEDYPDLYDANGKLDTNRLTDNQRQVVAALAGIASAASGAAVGGIDGAATGVNAGVNEVMSNQLYNSGACARPEFAFEPQCLDKDHPLNDPKANAQANAIAVAGTAIATLAARSGVSVLQYCSANPLTCNKIGLTITEVGGAGGAASMAAPEIRAAVNSVTTIYKGTTRNIATEGELLSLWNKISAGGRSVPFDKGTAKVLSDGTRVQLRSESTSGLGKTIDIKYPSGKEVKIHITRGN